MDVLIDNRRDYCRMLQRACVSYATAQASAASEVLTLRQSDIAALTLIMDDTNHRVLVHDNARQRRPVIMTALVVNQRVAIDRFSSMSDSMLASDQNIAMRDIQDIEIHTPMSLLARQDAATLHRGICCLAVQSLGSSALGKTATCHWAAFRVDQAAATRAATAAATTAAAGPLLRHDFAESSVAWQGQSAASTGRQAAAATAAAATAGTAGPLHCHDLAGSSVAWQLQGQSAASASSKAAAAAPAPLGCRDFSDSSCPPTSSSSLTAALRLLRGSGSGAAAAAAAASAAATASSVASAVDDEPPTVIITWVVDSASANLAAFALEQGVWLKRKGRGESGLVTLLLCVRCCLHQANLILRPSLLSVRGVASNLIRLANLFKTRRFRERFKSCLAVVVRERFKRWPCEILPGQAASWRSRSSKLMTDTAAADAGLPKDLLPKVLSLLNGNTQERNIDHYCLPDCAVGCTDDEHAREQAAHLLQQLFAAPAPVPLLYRWKHFDRALSWARRAVGLHALLPAVLRSMLDKEKAGPERQSGGDTAQDKDTKELTASFAEQQAARANEADEFFSSKDASAKLAHAALLSEPASVLTNRLFVSPWDLREGCASEASSAVARARAREPGPGRGPGQSGESCESVGESAALDHWQLQAAQFLAMCSGETGHQAGTTHTARSPHPCHTPHYILLIVGTFNVHHLYHHHRHLTQSRSLTDAILSLLRCLLLACPVSAPQDFADSSSVGVACWSLSCPAVVTLLPGPSLPFLILACPVNC